MDFPALDSAIPCSPVLRTSDPHFVEPHPAKAAPLKCAGGCPSVAARFMQTGEQRDKKPPITTVAEFEQGLRSRSLACATISGLDLAGMALTGADLSGVRWQNVDLSGARPAGGCVLKGTSWEGCNLLDVNLAGAVLEGGRLYQGTGSNEQACRGRLAPRRGS